MERCRPTDKYGQQRTLTDDNGQQIAHCLYVCGCRMVGCAARLTCPTCPTASTPVLPPTLAPPRGYGVFWGFLFLINPLLNVFKTRFPFSKNQPFPLGSLFSTGTSKIC